MTAPAMTAPAMIAAPGFAAPMGVARGDITPPAGVHNRCWGAATQATAIGAHRPLTVTVLVIAGDQPAAIVAIDGSWWQTLEAERALRGAVAVAIGAAPDAVLTCLSHSHSAVPLLASYDGLPGGDLAAAWWAGIPGQCAALASQALAAAQPATLTWASGHCALARNRDLEVDGAWLVGCNPAAPADDTLLAGRVVDATEKVLATLVNYACHPTTLAWDNRLISPDWPGAMRAVVEAEHAAPCLFLQGAGGDLAPAEQYVGDPAVADRHGRMVGHAACAALAGLGTPGHALAFAGSHASGASLALWREVPRSHDRTIRCTRLDLQPSLRPTLETIAELDAALAVESDEALAERLRRRRRVRQMIGDGDRGDLPVWAWRLGQTLVVGIPGEPYSLLQQRLRAAFPDHAVVVINHANGGSGYLMPEDCYARPGFYAAWQTPFAAGAFELLTDAALRQLTRLVEIPS